MTIKKLFQVDLEASGYGSFVVRASTQDHAIEAAHAAFEDGLFYEGPDCTYVEEVDAADYSEDEIIEAED